MSPTLVLLPDDERQRILDAAAAAYPREACGIVAGGRVVVLANVAADAVASRSFETDPVEVRAAVSAAGGWSAVSAVWHSHPEVAGDPSSGSPFPSDLDVEAHPVGCTLIVVSNGEVYGYVHD